MQNMIACVLLSRANTCALTVIVTIISIIFVLEYFVHIIYHGLFTIENIHNDDTVMLLMKCVVTCWGYLKVLAVLDILPRSRLREILKSRIMSNFD